MATVREFIPCPPPCKPPDNLPNRRPGRRYVRSRDVATLPMTSSVESDRYTCEIANASSDWGNRGESEVLRPPVRTGATNPSLEVNRSLF